MMPDMWKGQPLEEMTKEELMEALRQQAKMYSDLLDERASDDLRRIWSMRDDLRRLSPH
tara:strand:+ start:837 stop:1013 length:177 start_codon:yes stop_codon:yes gene_type:complete